MGLFKILVELINFNSAVEMAGITISSKASGIWNIQTSTTWCQNLCSIWMPWHYQCSFPLIIFLAFSISWSKTLDCPRYLGRICSIADTLVDHLNPRWAKYSQWCVEVQDFGRYSYFLVYFLLIWDLDGLNYLYTLKKDEVTPIVLFCKFIKHN